MAISPQRTVVTNDYSKLLIDTSIVRMSSQVLPLKHSLEYMLLHTVGFTYSATSFSLYDRKQDAKREQIRIQQTEPLKSDSDLLSKRLYKIYHYIGRIVYALWGLFIYLGRILPVQKDVILVQNTIFISSIKSLICNMLL